jgi:ABC-type multidrug transport system ATPase subunit
MTISLNQAGKRYNRDWIFRHCSYAFETGMSYAITGPNGSGKSTLLQCIAGATALSEGKLELSIDGRSIDSEQLFRSIAIAAPYLELIEELTATELLEFQKGFKPLMSEFTIPEILSQVQLERAAQKQIRYFSSGMKQRLKLAQAIFSAVPVLLLDEPCTNLDQAGVQLYHQLMNRYAKDKLVVVCSNDPIEYNFVQAHLSITDYKPAESASSRIS